MIRIHQIAKATTLSLLSVCAAHLYAAPVQLTERGVINVNKPAFLFLDRDNASSPYRLMITAFQVFGSDQVSSIENIGANLGQLSAAPVKAWTNEATWPNEVSRAPDAVFGRNFYVIAGGFLVPGKSQGGLWLFDRGQGKVLRKLSAPKKDYWYHHVVWADMNGDGRLDLLTARATKSMFGHGSGELVWFEQPVAQFVDEWTEHVIAQGPDVNFIYEDLDGDGQNEILATEFFGRKLTLLQGSGDDWTATTVDDRLGAGFNLSAVDLNGDGRKEILATNHEAKGAVFAYEIPGDLHQTPWVRHTLIDGVATTASGFGQASIGTAAAFYPTANAAGKPSIVVAGDGAQIAFILNPASTDPADWTYQQQVFLKVKKGVIGQIAVGDVDGDGKVDLFVPAYDENAIHVYSVK